MDAITTYTCASATWLGIQAVPLLLTPKLITTLLSQEARGPTGIKILAFPDQFLVAGRSSLTIVLIRLGDLFLSLVSPYLVHSCPRDSCPYRLHTAYIFHFRPYAAFSQKPVTPHLPIIHVML